MDVFAFASNNLTNIWAGIGARMWAVSILEESPTTQSRRTRSQNMKIGSLGILYCKETQSLTTPFIVYSKPDPKIEVSNIWPETWTLPFRIFPLGSPTLQLHKDEAKRILPIFKSSNEANFGHTFHVQALTAFSPSAIGGDDWELLVSRLSAGAKLKIPEGKTNNTKEWFAELDNLGGEPFPPEGAPVPPH